MFINVCVVFVFGLQTLKLKDFAKIYQLKGLKLKSKGHANFYECCDLTKKVYKHPTYIILMLMNEGERKGCCCC